MDFKKIPLRVYFILLVALIFGISSGILFFRIINNHLFVKAYAEGEYKTEKEEGLLKLNVPESYLPYYNLGNVAYENGDYASAVGYYNEALSLFPYGEKECDIRINLALAMCYGIDWQNMDSKEDIDTALVVLYKARDVLLVNNWATEDGEGHRDDDAQQLKEDIDAMIEKLKNQQGDQSQDNQDQQDNKQDNSGQQDNSQSEDDKSQSEKEKRLQKELEGEKKDALDERSKNQDDLKKWGSYSDGQGGDKKDGEDAGSGYGGGGGRYKPW